MPFHMEMTTVVVDQVAELDRVPFTWTKGSCDINN